MIDVIDSNMIGRKIKKYYIGVRNEWWSKN